MCENSVTENVAAAKIDVDDELHCPEIDVKIVFICFQCGIEYIPKNYMKGDKIDKQILYRRHLGVSKCAKCGKQIIGLRTLRVHSQACLVSPYAMTLLML